MQPLRTALVVTALLTAVPVAVMAQASQRIERSTEEVVDQIDNPCNGEPVQITGTFDVTTRRTVDANGVVHLASNSVPNLRGVGPSGEYNVGGGTHVRDKFIDNEWYPENVSFSDSFHLLSKGKGLNFLFTMNGHFVVETDGTVKNGFQARVGEVHRRPMRSQRRSAIRPT
jgi:hypothetical protein